MYQVMPYLMSLSQLFSKPMLGQLLLITQAMLCCRGRITMLGLSRWSQDSSCGYRRIQRFYSKPIDWLKVNWILIKAHRLNRKEVYLLAGDETTVSKAGKHTYGLGKFFSSIHSRHVKGLGFFSLSLIGVSSRQACPLLMEQLPAEMSRKTRASKKASTTKRSKGRPKGSKNKNHRSVELTEYLKWIQAHIKRALEMVEDSISIAYFVYDGAFGNNESLRMVKACGISMISKLQCRAALWFPYEGSYGGQGAPNKYGEKVNYSKLPKKALRSVSVEKGIEEKIFQMPLWHKSFADLINVTIIQRRRLSDQKVGRVILFSDDLELSWDHMICYYRLRFQIEFTFRDAKQFWGLEDFMNIREQSVSNAANLSMFMVNLSKSMIGKPGHQTAGGIHDLKAKAQAEFFMEKVFKTNPEIARVISFEKLKRDVGDIDCIHQTLKAA